MHTHSKLHHPNIVRMLGACWDPPNICLVLEYHEKGGLNDLLRNKEERLTWRKINMDMLIGIARAIVCVCVLLCMPERRWRWKG